MNTFGENFLAAIEARAAANKGQDVVFCSVLREIVRDALGFPQEAAATAPQPIHFTLNVPKEFPQFRVKHSTEGVEIARRRVNSLDDLGRLIKEDFSWASATPIPAEKEY